MNGVRAGLENMFPIGPSIFLPTSVKKLPKPAPKPAPETKKIAGRDAAAEAAAARRRARRGRAGGLMAASDVVADVAGTGLPALGETGLGIEKTKLG